MKFLSISWDRGAAFPFHHLVRPTAVKMATLQGTGIPKVKLESVPDENIKREPFDTPSPFPDEDEDMYEDAGDLDFSQAQQRLWLSHIPRTLWESLSRLKDDDEIEIGKVRVEGPDSHPSRVREYSSKSNGSRAADTLINRLA